MTAPSQQRVSKYLPWYRVKPNEVLVVRRIGGAYRFCGAGEVWISPLIDEVVGTVDISFRYVDNDVQVQAVDGHPITYAVRMCFVYDPRTAQPEQQVGFVLKVLGTTDIFRHLLDVMVGASLRTYAAVRYGRELIDGEKLVKLARTTEDNLRNQLAEMGIRLSAGQGIQIRSIRSPRCLREATEWIGFAKLVSDELGIAPERMATYLMALKLYEQAASGNNVLMLPSLWGADSLIPPQAQQLLNGAAQGHRGAVANRPRPVKTSPIDPVVETTSQYPQT